MLSPGPELYPDHRVSTQPLNKRVDIFVDGDKVVETMEALQVFETDHDPVIYVPKSEVQNLTFIKSGEYHCPFKGHAIIYDVKHYKHVFKNAAWSYVRPYSDMMEIKDLIAFYPSKVQAIQVTG